ncbi:MAG: mechanosensitive ion channel protein, partial [Gammaproteobacteria bacterium]|nr:mechanosensitive ion channel protein [Gammaproteobacteria bacterium]
IMMRRRSVDITAAVFISKFIYIAILTFSVIAALSQVGVETDSILALIAGSALAVGFALRNTLSNLAAGILLIMFRPPFKVGNVVEVSGQIGLVTDIGFLYTKMQNAENKIIAIPNGILMNSPVIDYWANPIRITDVSVLITYESDLLAAKAILLEVAEKQPNILKYPKAFVAVNGLKDIGVSIFARVGITKAVFDETVWAFQEAIKLAFDANDIKFAQRTILQIKDFHQEPSK